MTSTDVRRDGAYHRRGGRALIEVMGANRAAWLSNLITNVVKTLSPGDGNYAFATNVKGRVLFDLNVLVLDDRLWVDIDERRRDAVLKHFEKYTITEDVTVSVLESARVAVMGPAASVFAKGIGVGHFTPMPQLQHVDCAAVDGPVRMVRHDFVGLPTAEFVATGPDVVATADGIARRAVDAGLVEIDAATASVLRIEAGIPADVEDIDEDVVPPETMQVERGICYTKGCYLGQEIIERMRSHGVLARRLVGIRFEGDTVVTPQSVVKVDDAAVGRTMSGCLSDVLGAPLSIGYLKSSHARVGTAVVAETAAGLRRGEVVALPVT